MTVGAMRRSASSPNVESDRLLKRSPDSVSSSALSCDDPVDADDEEALNQATGDQDGDGAQRRLDSSSETLSSRRSTYLPVGMPTAPVPPVSSSPAPVDRLVLWRASTPNEKDSSGFDLTQLPSQEYHYGNDALVAGSYELRALCQVPDLVRSPNPGSRGIAESVETAEVHLILCANDGKQLGHKTLQLSTTVPVIKVKFAVPSSQAPGRVTLSVTNRSPKSALNVFVQADLSLVESFPDTDRREDLSADSLSKRATSSPLMNIPGAMSRFAGKGVDAFKRSVRKQVLRPPTLEQRCELLGFEMPSSYEVLVSIPQNGVPGRKLNFQAALPVGEAFHKISTVKRAAREFSGRPRLCVPCTWGADVWMNNDLPLWMYDLGPQSLSALTVRFTTPQHQPPRGQTVIVRVPGDEPRYYNLNKEHSSEEIIRDITRTLHLSVDLDCAGLFLYTDESSADSGESGSWITDKASIEDIPEMSIVEVRPRPVYRVAYRDASGASCSQEFPQSIRFGDIVKHLLALDHTLCPLTEDEEFELCLQDSKTSDFHLLPNETSIISLNIPKGSILQLRSQKDPTRKLLCEVTRSPVITRKTRDFGFTDVLPGEIFRMSVAGQIFYPEQGWLNVIILVSSARLAFAPVEKGGRYKDWTSLPLGYISRLEKVGSRSGFGKQENYALDLYCKDFRTIRIEFSRKTQARSILAKTLSLLCFPIAINTIFAFTLKKNWEGRDDGWSIYSVDKEFLRQQVKPDQWRITLLNAEYHHCPTYPQKLLVPAAFDDNLLPEVFDYRSKGRIPALSYYNRHNSATITRSSQPMCGITRATCSADEQLLDCIRKANRVNPGILYIFDARPRANAMGNQALGAGYEATGSGTGYERCKLEFLNIDNIHVMRNSATKLQSLTESRQDSNWYSALESTKWLSHVRQVLISADRIRQCVIDENASVLVHCSDGWDRTAQLCSLAELLIDEDYRTIEGFEGLVEKEWVHFGHKFATRNGFFDKNHNDDQRAPIFLQFIDAVWQLTQQFPCCFEFNERFLLDVYDGMLSCHYGTFLANCEGEAKQYGFPERTVSLWSQLNRHLDLYRNVFYVPHPEVLKPLVSMENITLWKSFYLRQGSKDQSLFMTPAHKGMQLKQDLDRMSEANRQLRDRVAELEKELQLLRDAASSAPESLPIDIPADTSE